MSKWMLCVVCHAPVMGQASPPHMAALVHNHPWDSLPLCPLVHLKSAQSPHHAAAWPHAGLYWVLMSPGVGQSVLV